MQLTKAQLAYLHRTAPDVPDDVWFRVHGRMVDHIHRQVVRHAVHHRHMKPRSGGSGNGCNDNELMRMLWIGQPIGRTAGGRTPKKRPTASARRRQSESARQQASAIRGAIDGSTANQKSAEAQVRSMPLLSAQQKADGLERLRTQQAELSETSAALKAQIAAEKPNASPTAIERSWNALKSFASIILLAFRNVFGAVYDALSWFVSDAPAADEVRKSAATAAVNAALATETTWKTRIWKGVKWLGNAIISGLKAAWTAVSWIFPTAVSLFKWIMSNPQTAKMTLIMANFIKKTLCRQLAVWIAGPESGLTVDLFDPLGMAKELQGPILVKATLAVVQSKAVDAAFDQTTDFVADTLGGFWPVGGLLKAVTKIAVGSIKESAREAIQFYAHYANTTASFGLLFDLVDPRPCIAAYSQQANVMRAILEATPATTKPKSKSKSKPKSIKK